MFNMSVNQLIYIIAAVCVLGIILLLVLGSMGIEIPLISGLAGLLNPFIGAT